MNLRNNFPTELLYLAKEKAGIGLTRLSDIVNKQKVKRMICMAYGKPFTTTAQIAQIDTALKLSHNESHPWGQGTVNPATQQQQQCLLNSQIQWAAEENIMLTVGGFKFGNDDWTEIRINEQDMMNNTADILRNESALYYGDLVSKTISGWKYLLPAGAEIANLPQITLARNHKQIIRRDQAYLSWDGKVFHEILGILTLGKT